MYPLLLRLEKGARPGPVPGLCPGPPTEVLRPDRAGPGRTGPVPRQFQAMAAAVARLPGFAPEKEETP